MSQSNFTKYYACHAKWISWLIRVSHKTSFIMRGATRNHNPTSPNITPAMQNEVHDWSAWQMQRHFHCATDPAILRKRSEHKTITPQPASQPRLLFTLTSSIFDCKVQPFGFRLSCQNFRNTVPATKNDFKDCSSSHRKRHLECAEQQRLPSNITKYCPYHTKSF